MKKSSINDHFSSTKILKSLFTARPRNIEVQDADASSTAIKRRLPSEVKQKLAKVAKLAVQKTFSFFSYVKLYSLSLSLSLTHTHREHE